MSQQRPRERVRDRVPERTTGSRTRPVSTGRRYAPPPPPPSRDVFPFVMGGIIGALVVGLMVVIFLITANTTNTTNIAGNNPAVSTNTAASSDTSGQAQPATGQTPPRMALADFKALYDDPARRPLIVDVRPKTTYDQGHIKGAVSIPEAEIDTRLSEIPKDKLVVAYCQ